MEPVTHFRQRQNRNLHYRYGHRTDPKRIRTLLYRAASARSFGRIPRRWLTDQTLLTEEQLPDCEFFDPSILHYAAMRGSLNLLPARFLTPKNLLNKSSTLLGCCFCLAAIYGKLHCIPKRLMTLENLRHSCNGSSKNIFHWAAETGQLGVIPRALLTEESLLIPDSLGYTAFHNAARDGYLDQIPSNFKTLENLLLRTIPDYSNVFHFAAIHGHLNQIPVAYLTPEIVLDSDGDGVTVVGYAVEACQVSRIPITPELAARLSEVKTATLNAFNHPASFYDPSHTMEEMKFASRGWHAKLVKLALKNAQTPKK
jgi:ankyrin repeat protein